MFAKPTAKTKETTPGVWPFVLPFLVYMVVASRSPSLGPDSIDDVGVNNYYYLVIGQVVVGFGLIVFFLRKILQEFPFRIDLWGFVVGVGGFILWIWLCGLGLERQALSAIGLESWLPERVGFNPFLQMTDDGQRQVFLAFRFTLMAALVPMIEELFLRGWFVRYIEDPNWHTVKLSAVRTSGIIAVAVYAIVTHPGEAIAAVVWFTLVSVMMIKTGKFWNCVVAHAVTNLLLALYVVNNSQWQLW